MIKLRRINLDWQRFVALLFGCFPHEENFRSEHSGIFSCEWNSIFRNLRKRRHPREVYQKTEKSLTGNFRPIDFLSATLEFSVEWFKFPKFSNFRVFRKLFKDVFVPSVFLFERPEDYPSFRKFLTENFNSIWFSSLLRGFFSGFSGFPPSTKNVFSAGMKLIEFVSSLFFVICWSTPLGRVSRDFVVGWC